MKNKSKRYAIFCLLFLIASCSDFHDTFLARVPGSIGNGRLTNTLRTEKAEDEDIEEGETERVSGVRVSRGEYGDKIVISWKKSDRATYYKIYRSVKGDSRKTLIAESVVSVRYEDKFEYPDISTQQLRYVYQVEAFRGERVVGRLSFPVEGHMISVPRGVASKDSQTIVVKWKKVKGAQGYTLYRSEKSDTFGKEIARISSEHPRVFRDEGSHLDFNTLYYYRVVPLSRNGRKVKISLNQHPFVAGIRIKAGAPPAPQNVEASKGTSTDAIVISWSEVPSSYAGNISYKIWQENPHGEYKPIVLASKVQTTKGRMSYAHKDGVEIRKKYRYSVQAVLTEINDENKKWEGAHSSSKEDRDKGFLLSPPPTEGFSARRGDNDKTVKIRWKKGWGATNYKIYRASEENGDYEEMGSSGGNPHYTDTIGAEDRAFYKIVALGTNNGGSEIATLVKNSEKVEVTPPKVTGVTASDNKYDAEAPDKNKHEVYPIKVEWKKAAGATTYSVYRSEAKANASDETCDPNAEAYTLIPNADRITETHYFDSYSKMGKGSDKDGYDEKLSATYYCYRVKARNRDKYEGKASDADRGYGAISNLQFLRFFQYAIIQGTNDLDPEKHFAEVVFGNGRTVKGKEQGTAYIKVSTTQKTVLTKFSGYAKAVDPFQNKPFIVITGESRVFVEDLISKVNGFITSEDIKVGGTYPGIVKIQDVLMKTDKVIGGKYNVSQKGSSGVPAGVVEATAVPQHE